MLREAVLAAHAQPEDDGFHRGQLSITGISPCPYGTYINYHKLDPHPASPAEILNMKNGNWQEEEMVADLKKAGFRLRYTGKDQMVVHVGRARVGGRPDGLIEVFEPREDVLSCKAVNTRRNSTLNKKGLDGEPFIRCQEQMYLASDELKDRYGCWVYYKHKDSNYPGDLFEERNDEYSKPIVEVTDAIILEGYVPERPDVCPIMGGCRHKTYCMKQDLLNLSGVAVADLPEVVRQWKEGKFYKDYGKMLQDEARETLIKELGSREILFVESLSVQRIVQNRTSISKEKFVEHFGSDKLPLVLVTQAVEQIRINDTEI